MQNDWIGKLRTWYARSCPAVLHSRASLISTLQIYWHFDAQCFGILEHTFITMHTTCSPLMLAAELSPFVVGPGFDVVVSAAFCCPCIGCPTQTIFVVRCASSVAILHSDQHALMCMCPRWFRAVGKYIFLSPSILTTVTIRGLWSSCGILPGTLTLERHLRLLDW